jgi:hypothetical protein
MPNDGASLAFTFRPQPAPFVTIEYTPCLNPVHRQTLNDGTADSNGNVKITGRLSENPPTRFYRTVFFCHAKAGHLEFANQFPRPWTCLAAIFLISSPLNGTQLTRFCLSQTQIGIIQ